MIIPKIYPQKSPHYAGFGYLQRLTTAMRNYTAREGEARHQLFEEVMLFFIISRSCKLCLPEFGCHSLL
ncbi:hypothetical protein BS639_15475 [Rouxiella silvae]|uniref:Uncharacterized protein n=1 Tax=Rouxiella silvae TaxID=1646373 RepID=A0AA40X335_9GAMM|nr:hypothetical protein [Rouxiella silvae]KQN51762.1 hypothetical protein ASE93_00955 [Serratia sp. Leaf50]MBF6637660.1 hypothetical protein [Rouxiella silvae]ORJ20370.1 hypothetical protein BS639_15475 [Rouxiella silvae]